MLRSDKATHHICFQFFLTERLINSLEGSDVLLFSEFTNILFILYYKFIEICVLL